VVPVALLEMMMDPDAKKSGQVMKAFMTMKKFDIAALKRAYEGETV
jgi:predicted 3-demethylubiquinone-9 3-methyltransferase (glyoxalase superfamily)